MLEPRVANEVLPSEEKSVLDLELLREALVLGRGGDVLRAAGCDESLQHAAIATAGLANVKWRCWSSV